MFETEELSARTLMSSSEIISDNQTQPRLQTDARHKYYCANFFTRFFRSPETSILDVRTNIPHFYLSISTKTWPL